MLKLKKLQTSKASRVSSPQMSQRKLEVEKTEKLRKEHAKLKKILPPSPRLAQIDGEKDEKLSIQDQYINNLRLSGQYRLSNVR